MSEVIPAHFRTALLSQYTSRQNKLWMATAWKHFHPWHLEWKWAGDPWVSRMLFQFSCNGPWVEAKSYDEDVWPLLKFDKERKKPLKSEDPGRIGPT